MKAITKYQCDVCGAFWDTEGECAECERSHDRVENPVTVADAIKHIGVLDGTTIEWYVTVKFKEIGTASQVWVGKCRYQDGKLIPLDFGNYSLDEEIEYAAMLESGILIVHLPNVIIEGRRSAK